MPNPIMANPGMKIFMYIRKQCVLFLNLILHLVLQHI